MNPKRPKIAVVLAGCGFKDGAEIRESVLALWALDVAGADVEIFAPSTEFQEIDHLTFEPTGKTRSVLQEAARIARGKIKDVAHALASDFDGLVLPGGYGAAKNLCTFASEGPNCSIDPHVEKFIQGFIAASKPIGAICIAPAIIAKAFQKHGGVKITIGDDGDAAAAAEQMGAKHIVTKTSEIAIDADRKVVTTPAYMDDNASLKDVAEGIRKLVDQVVKWAGVRV